VSGPLLTADELAERWRVPVGHVYRLAREGRIPAVRLGRYVRFHPDAVERFELGSHSTTKEDAP
jgi:excisionase family DNA binding protein